MRDILNSYNVRELKKEISKTNIKGYSKMKKNDVIDLMMKNEEKFKNMKMKGMEPEPKKKIPFKIKTTQKKKIPFKIKAK